MRMCITELMQVAELLPDDDVAALTSIALMWGARMKSNNQTDFFDFFMSSSKRDNTRPASSILSLASGSARRK